MQMNKDAVININNLSFDYGDNQVLCAVNLEVKDGDFLAIIGPNGSGKTTLLRLILGLEKAKNGTIKLLGELIENFKDHKKLGYMPQKATHFNNNFPATVLEIVMMGLINQKSKWRFFKAADRQKALDALAKVEMVDLSQRRIGELSGGQQQRVLIAKALISNPKVLFLDEPTTGIDPGSQSRFYKLLGKLNQSGITIILVSHDVGRVTKYVNKIAQVNRHLEFYGSHAEFCVWDSDHHHQTKETHRICSEI
jgi:zinc transport system ATP-binding protein